MWTRSITLSFLLASVFLCMSQAAGAQRYRVGRIDPVTIQAPTRPGTQPIVRSVRPPTIRLSPPRSRVSTPGHLSLASQFVQDPLRIMRRVKPVEPYKEIFQPLRQEEIRFGRQGPRFPELAAFPKTTPAAAAATFAPSIPSAPSNGGGFGKTASLSTAPAPGDSRSDVLRALGTPSATVSRSTGQETLVFENATVVLQNGVVALIH
jgi:hypothetical protein